MSAMMMCMSNQHELMRLRDVIELTGWENRYVRKLVKLKVLKVFQPNPRLRPLYYRSQIVEMQKMK